MNSAFGQEAVHVPHWIHTRMLSPPGMAAISSANDFSVAVITKKPHFRYRSLPVFSGLTLYTTFPRKIKEPIVLFFTLFRKILPGIFIWNKIDLKVHER
jgi:hypothetical protein